MTTNSDQRANTGVIHGGDVEPAHVRAPSPTAWRSFRQLLFRRLVSSGVMEHRELGL